MSASPGSVPVISGSTRLLGIIGWPLTYTLSPCFQNAGLHAAGLDYAYLPFPVADADFDRALAGLRTLRVRGFNVTIPYKERILPLLDAIDPVAAAVGAVNTVVAGADNRWTGYNTDSDGFRAGLPDPDALRGAACVITGAGGAARAVSAALTAIPVGGITLYDPVTERAQALAAHLAQQAPVMVTTVARSREELAAAVAAAALTVNASPLGLHDHDPLPLDAAWLTRGSTYYDLVYQPEPTPMMRAAASRGVVTVGGREMLLQQGARSFALWTGAPPPLDVMRAALQAALAS